MKRLWISLVIMMLLPLGLSIADMTRPVDTKLSQAVMATPPTLSLQPQEVSTPIELAPISVKYQKRLTSSYQRNKPSSYAAFLSYASSDEYKIKKKVFLVKAHHTRNKQAFMFVFLMNKPKVQEPTDPGMVFKPEKQRGRMHILWTGSRKTLKEQKVINNEYPVDISIDNYAEGYAENEWNLVLPNKKPREVTVSLMWVF